MSEAQRITKALRGHWHGRYGLCFCPSHANTRTPSLSVSDGVGGRLLARCHAGCDFVDILDALKGLGLIEGEGHYSPPSAAELEKARQEEERQAIRQEQRALECWNASQPIEGTIAEAYVRGRGISCRLPPSLRFNPDCYHPSTKRLPALVAAVEGAARFAVHRTFILPDGSGKTAIDPPKAMLGKVGGGAVRLTSDGYRLVVAEGIETALSLASGLVHGSPTIWASLSTSGMKSLVLPAAPGSLLIATDGEDAGRLAGNILAERAAALGWQVNLLPAPDGCDWNDILQKECA